ncbi:23 kDa integral membrane protein [Helicoverpa armigera]|nr:23 kDa integral membrane protein [Helicoverpa armigera]XP_047028376.1 23 kDa integral membrane protein-like [Helicoverpa zea]PZC84591.1 hypothetical protein B5X24_HaOG204621 [Helicoverpa armigera]
MGCGEFLVKYILFFANLVFALAGLTLLGLGVAVQLQSSDIVQIADFNFEVAPITSMVVGGIVFFIAFFGCCGAIRESNCMLVTYSIFMLLLMIVKLTLAILIFVKLDDVVNEVPKWLKEAFNKDRTEFQAIERTFTCCGPDGALSYMSPLLPDTCCATPPCTPVNPYPSCTQNVQEFFQTFGVAIGSIMIVIVSIELVAAVFGLCLANTVRNKSRRAHY